jgi:sulfonate transport system permease protein
VNVATPPSELPDDLVVPTSTRRSVRPPQTSLVIRLILPIAIVAAWTWLAGTTVLPEGTLPTPVEVWRQWHAMWTQDDLLGQLLASFGRSAFGLAIGASIGFSLGLYSGLSRLGEELIDAPLQMMRAVPFVALIPLFILWFGIGETPKIIIIALATYYPMYVNTATGVRNVDRKIVECANAFDVHGPRLLMMVILPLALPAILTGLRLSLVISVLALVIAEQINAQSGIGFLLVRATSYGQSFTVFACVALYALTGLFADLLVRTIERVVLRWRAGVAIR